jgi:Ca-activated chloride channel homolog
MRRVSFLFTILLLASVAFASGRTQVKQGNVAAKTGDAEQAFLHYKRALDQGADSSVVMYDVGNLLYNQKDYDKASKAFMGSLDPKATPAEQTETLYNLGNAFYQSEKYDEAAEAYKEALKRAPADTNAKFNYELAKYRQREKKQQQQQNQQDQNQQKKDQQKQQEQQQQDKKQQDQQNQQQQQQQQADQQKDEQGQQPQQAQQMSKEDAERLLNALLQDEQDALKDAKKVKVATKVKRDKDW